MAVVGCGRIGVIGVRTRDVLALGAAGVTAAAAWAAWSNGAIQTTSYELVVDRLPRALDGLRIAHISDLHNAELGRGNGRLIKRICRARPDLIVVTGDLIDSRRTRIDAGVHLAARAAREAPTYYVPGNHEARLQEYPQIASSLERAGVVVLENGAVPFERDGGQLILLGLMDPAFQRPYPRGATPRIIDEQLARVLATAGIDCDDAAAPCTVLLTHRPELLDVYAAHGVDVAFAGHAHGGQVRLPGVGALFAPSQGFFPAITAGVHTSGRTQLVVSRGLGPSVVPLRVNNRPELVVATLRCRPAAV
ncbi:metallophosphoesterase [Collinsella sp. D33t1_170424_A12]|uniref:metallophosphoesterase n=1 Tax=Collinsella sp. D33t1_170424_A12 TaxID=2787135 RepID=UPI001E334B51|nr:metallophosphoesterase [Collinsella sp. D33t1_170424_A12]